MDNNTTAKQLTANEKVAIEEQLYNAFQKQWGLYNRHPSVMPELTSQRTRQFLKVLINLVPIGLFIILLAAMFISAERTFYGFSSTAHSPYALVRALVGIAANVFVEGSLFFGAFMLRWGRIQGQDNNTYLKRYLFLAFLLALGSNLYATVIPVLENPATGNALIQNIQLGFTLFLGFVVPFAIHNMGDSLAILAYGVYQREIDTKTKALQEAYEAKMKGQWEIIKDQELPMAWHTKYCMKNKLSINTNSPFLLVSGGEGSIEVQDFLE